MAMLAGYFDDSGTHDGSPSVVVAGGVASVQQWIKLSREWQAAIAPWNLKRAYFHMADFVSSVGDYHGWAAPMKAERLSKLVRIIRKHVRLLVGNAVRSNEFDEAIKEHPNKKIGTAYRFCAFLIFPAVDAWRRQSPRREPVAFIFEAGNKLMNEYGKIFGEIGEYEYLRKKYGVGSATQGTKRDMLPLQAADVIAYATYKCLVQKTLEPYLKDAFTELFKIKHKGMMYTRSLIDDGLKKFAR